jgi:periplasmic protein TonB
VFRLTAIGLRISMLGLSGAVHAALFLTPLGHPGAAKVATLEPSLVDIDVEPLPKPPAPLPDVPFENRVTTMPTHTHPYPVPASHDFTPHDPSLVHVMVPEAAPKADTSAILTATATAPTTHVPTFTMAISFGAPGAGGMASSANPNPAAGHTHDDHGDAAGDTLAEQQVDAPARLLHGGTPIYPSDARSDGIEADVKLELVVSAAGKVEDVKLVRPAGHGLDEAAMIAAREYRFSPASKGGHAVRVRMSWAVQFRLD